MAWGVGERKLDLRKGPSGKVVPLDGAQTDEAGGETMEKKTKGQRNLAGGMDLLDMDFLLGVIESNGTDKNDVAMRKLTFNEVLRRNQQNEIDSVSLSAYAVDERGLYGKDIQCAAMKELARRTEQKPS